MTSNEPPSQTPGAKPEPNDRPDPDNRSNDAPKPEKRRRAAKTRITRRLAIGDAIERTIGPDGVATLKNRNWTATGAGLVALGVVADISQIFGPIALVGFVLSLFAAGVFATVVFLRLKWRDSCIGHTFSALLTAALFGVVLFLQHAARAGEHGVIVENFPGAAKIQIAIYEKIVGIQEKQGEINTKIDQLTEEVRAANESERLSKDAQLWVGTWRLESPYQPGWVVTYKEDGTYFFTSPQATLNGVWQASDGLFRNEAPGTGLSDAGSFRFRDKNTLEVTGKFGVSIWKREHNPPKSHSGG